MSDTSTHATRCAIQVCKKDVLRVCLRKGFPTLAYFLHYITFSFLAAKQHVGLELGEDGLHALPHGALEGAPARQAPAGARALVSERPQGAQARGGKGGGDEP